MTRSTVIRWVGCVLVTVPLTILLASGQTLTPDAVTV